MSSYHQITPDAEMSMAVRHRYEKMGFRPSKEFNRQQVRITADAMIVAREKENDHASDINLKSDWKEKMQDVGFV